VKLSSYAHCLLISIFASSILARNTSGAEPPVKGQVVVSSSFDTDAELAAWQGDKHLDSGMNGGKALRVERMAGAASGSGSLRLPIPVENLRGCVLRGTVMVKAENVSAKPNAWNGIKVMLPIETPDRKLWPQAPVETGTFDWTRVSFTAKIPSDASALSLVLGLEQVTGKVWFDNLKLTVAKIPPGPKPPPAAGPMFRGHDLPRLRGTMISPNIDEDGLRRLGRDWNANLIRWQLIRNSKSADYDAWLEAELKRLDAALPLCEKYGPYVALDLHSPPGGKMTSGGYAGSDGCLFTDRAAQDKFVEIWKKLAARYKNSRAIWGFDLANEPVEEQVGEDCDDWHDLAERAAKAIRAIDPGRTLIVEAPPWGSPESLADFIPLSVPNGTYLSRLQ